MTGSQAKRLGRLVQQARLKRGWSLMTAVEQTGLDSSWLNRLERGMYADPAPDRLALLAEALTIDPVAIDRASRDHLADSLPEVRTYFRSKEKLSPEALDEVEHALAEIRARHASPDDTTTATSSPNPIEYPEQHTQREEEHHDNHSNTRSRAGD